MKNIVVLISCIAFFTFACVYLHSTYPENPTDLTLGQNESSSIDMIDYHFVATNFAFTGRFPVTGYILDTAVYKIKAADLVSRIYLDMFRKNGPVTTFTRAPLYPLLVGSMYKVFGFKYYYNLILNILLLALVIGLMPAVGYYQWGMKGYFSGLAGALIFLKSCHDSWALDIMDSNVFSTFLFFQLFAVGLYAERKGKPRYYVLWGISTALFLLAKPILMPLPVVFAVFILIKSRQGTRLTAAKKIAAMLIGLTLTISPWTAYINHIKNITVSERDTWCARVMADEARPEIANVKDYRELLITSPGNPKYEMVIKVIKYLTKTLWVYDVRSTGFIFITNAGGDILLDFNNEYCTDGADVHFEWRLISSSFYRKYCTDSQSTITKLFLFYIHHPAFLYIVPIYRFMNPFEKDYYRYYWFAAALWGLCVLQMRVRNITGRKTRLALTSLILGLSIMAFICLFAYSPLAILLLFIPLFCFGLLLFKTEYAPVISITYPLLWISLFAFVFFVYNYIYYMSLIMPVSCLCMVYFSLLLIEGFIRTGISALEK